MKIFHKILFSLLAVVLLGSAFTKVTTAQTERERYIVTFEEDYIVNQRAKDALESYGAQPLAELHLINGYIVLVPDQAHANALKNIQGVARVEADAEVHTLKPPSGCSPWPECKNDPEPTPTPEPSETTDWGVDQIDADLTWSTSTGAGIKVAVIDTGIDKDHVDLVANIAGGVNFVSKPAWKPANSDNWDDDNGHGTHVAGTIAAEQNGVGVVGVAPDASLYGVKVLDRNGSGYLSTVIQGIQWAVDNDMDVINMSLGSSSDVQALHDAVDAAYDAGVVVVAAAGNSGDGDGATNEVSYPAKYSSVIAVAATASDYSTPSWSSEGEEVEVAAPGVDILSTWNNGGYNTISGTSMASPHTAGVVALMLSDSPGMSPAQVRSTLQSTADDLGAPGHDVFYGYGLVDAQEAVTGVE
jgi:subtilisin family serine protease